MNSVDPHEHESMIDRIIRLHDPWIHVGDRMPEECVRVMVYANLFYAFAYLHDGNWVEDGAYPRIIPGVTHWQPLTKPKQNP